jgi:hypothetical protein
MKWLHLSGLGTIGPMSKEMIILFRHRANQMPWEASAELQGLTTFVRRDLS